MKALFSVLAAFLASVSLYSQNTITITSVPLELCGGTEVYVHFTTTGNYNPGNVFRLEITNNLGVFTGSMLPVATTLDSIKFAIPTDTYSGTNFRLRIISTNPAVTGNINANDITIYPLPRAMPLSVNNAPVLNTDLQLLVMPVAEVDIIQHSSGLVQMVTHLLYRTL